MKRILCAFLALLLCMLCACGVAEADRLQIKPSESTTEATACVHEYDRPECAEDRLCVRCGERAEPVKAHDMTQGDCVSPAVCKRCGYVGETAEHVFTGGGCVTPAVCEVCGAEGETTEHRFSERTCTEAGACAVCGVQLETQTESSSSAGMVWIPQSGSRYHRYASCSGMNGPDAGHAGGSGSNGLHALQALLQIMPFCASTADAPTHIFRWESPNALA